MNINAKIDDRHRKLLKEILWQDRQGDDGPELAAQMLANFERDVWADTMREAFELWPAFVAKKVGAQ